ncbi:MAG: peptidylprolyl isomerase [Desulfobulbaceae bacterium]|nr:peptidylprolyl isomerase [Desulfobulbaceae bacterium]
MFRAFFLAFLLLCPLTVQAASGASSSGANHTPTVTFETNMGNIVIELFDDKAPVTVANFRQYVKESFYDNLIFHRVISGFVIQGGGFESGMTPRVPTHPAIVNEASNGLDNKRGTLSMARTYVVNSATSQFFINLNDNPALDHQAQAASRYGYAVFGRVIEGMEVVDEIAAKPTTTVGQYRDVPAKEVVILKAYENVKVNVKKSFEGF